jgi:hypothetical protein
MATSLAMGLKVGAPIDYVTAVGNNLLIVTAGPGACACAGMLTFLDPEPRAPPQQASCVGEESTGSRAHTTGDAVLEMSVRVPRDSSRNRCARPSACSCL